MIDNRITWAARGSAGNAGGRLVRQSRRSARLRVVPGKLIVRGGRKGSRLSQQSTPSREVTGLPAPRRASRNVSGHELDAQPVQQNLRRRPKPLASVL